MQTEHRNGSFYKNSDDKQKNYSRSGGSGRGRDDRAGASGRGRGDHGGAYGKGRDDRAGASSRNRGDYAARPRRQEHDSDRDDFERRDDREQLTPEIETEIDNLEEELTLEGRNAVHEAFRAGRSIDRVYVQEGLTDGPILAILKDAAKAKAVVTRVSKERLDQMSRTGGRHQGVIAHAAAFDYAEVDDILKRAEEKGEAPFIFVLDEIEDPHNLGAIIRTANLAGAHGVIIPKRRAVGLTAVAAKASAGALNYTPVARVTNIARTIEELKEKGLWFVCADMGGEVMYKLNLTGPIGVVIGNEGSGVSRLVREKCDFSAAIPMKGDIDSLNASVAAGVLGYEIVRQRMMAGGSK